MFGRFLLNPGYLTPLLAALLLVIAVACGTQRNGNP